MFPETPVQLSNVFTASVRAWLDRDQLSKLKALKGDFADPDRVAILESPRWHFAYFEMYEEAHITAGISSPPVCVLSLVLVNASGKAETLKQVNFVFNDVTLKWWRV